MESLIEHAPTALKGRQLDCMLLVKEGLSSKHIARELNISPRTVDQHIAAALEVLGARSRMAAISLLYEMERADDQASVEQPFMLAQAAQADEPNVTVDLPPETKVASLPPIGGAENLASRRQRMAWMARIAAFSVMIGCATTLTIMGLFEMASGLNQ